MASKENAVVRMSPIESDEAGNKGETVGIKIEIGDASREVFWEEIKSDLIGYAIYFGLANKVSDTAAIKRDPTNGQPASPEEKAAKVFRMLDALIAGEWTISRGETGPKGGILFRAFAEAKPGHRGATDAVAFEAYVEEMAEKNGAKVAVIRKAIREDAAVAEVYARMNADKPAKAVKALSMD